MSTVSAQREDSDSQDTSGRDSREEWREPDHGGFDPSQALAGIEPLFHVSNKWFANWMAVGSEIVEFSRASFDRNLEVTKAIATSGSFGKAMELHADHARSTMHEYFTRPASSPSSAHALCSTVCWPGSRRHAAPQRTQRRRTKAREGQCRHAEFRQVGFTTLSILTAMDQPIEVAVGGCARIWSGG